MSNKTIQINELTKAQYPSHGGNKTTVAEKNGINPNDLIDFSASINPFGPPACLAQLLMETPRLLREYPDTECSAIKQKLSKTLEIPEDWLFMANGSTELIHLLPNLLEIKLGVAIIAPCFSEYEKAFSINDIPNHYISLPHEQDFHAEPSKLIPQLNLLDQLGAVVIGNPSQMIYIPKNKNLNSIQY